MCDINYYFLPPPPSSYSSSCFPPEYKSMYRCDINYCYLLPLSYPYSCFPPPSLPLYKQNKQTIFFALYLSPVLLSACAPSDVRATHVIYFLFSHLRPSSRPNDAENSSSERLSNLFFLPLCSICYVGDFNKILIGFSFS